MVERHLRRGISRVELLALLAIVAILTALILPAMYHARETARESHCSNHLRMVGIALENYHVIFESYPYGCLGNQNVSASLRWSWYPEMTSFFAQEWAPPIDFTQRSDRVANLPLTFKVRDKNGEKILTMSLRPPHGTICPSGVNETDAAGQTLATYVGMAGVGKDGPTLPVTHERAGMWAYDRMVTKVHAAKTASTTIHVIETAHDRGSWYRGGPATVRPLVDTSRQPIGTEGEFGGFHKGIAMTLLADGSVKPLSETIDTILFRNMATRTAEQ